MSHPFLFSLWCCYLLPIALAFGLVAAPFLAATATKRLWKTATVISLTISVDVLWVDNPKLMFRVLPTVYGHSAVSDLRKARRASICFRVMPVIASRARRACLQSVFGLERPLSAKRCSQA